MHTPIYRVARAVLPASGTLREVAEAACYSRLLRRHAFLGGTLPVSSRNKYIHIAHRNLTVYTSQLAAVHYYEVSNMQYFSKFIEYTRWIGLVVSQLIVFIPVYIFVIQSTQLNCFENKINTDRKTVG